MNVEDGSKVVCEHQVGGARVWGCERASRGGIDGGGSGEVLYCSKHHYCPLVAVTVLWRPFAELAGNIQLPGVGE